MLEVGCTSKSSYRIWDLEECDKGYGALRIDFIEVNAYKDGIMILSGEVCGNCEI